MLLPLQSQSETNGAWPSAGQAGFFSAKFERSLTRLLGKYKQVPRNKKIIESVNSFGIKGVRFKLRNKEYTKKSLILAQDER